jgi:hypothetical protein
MVKSDDPKGWSAEDIQWLNKLFDLVKKDHKINKTCIKTWLAERKAKIIDATQVQKRMHPQPQAWIKLLDRVKTMAVATRWQVQT